MVLGDPLRTTLFVISYQIHSIMCAFIHSYIY